MPKLRYDGEFIVGQSSSTRITPNFQMREFAGRNGRVRVHRDLVGALQTLRDNYGRSISIRGTQRPRGFRVGEPGVYVWVSVRAPEAFIAAAAPLLRRRELTRVQRRRDRVYVEVPEVSAPMAAQHAFATGVQVTAAYETTGDPYLQVTGNFDGAGLSFGPLQVNFGSGTLSTLMKRFAALDAVAYTACFDRMDHFHEWQRIIHSPRRNQIRWADEQSRGRRKQNLAQPWNRYLKNIGSVSAFREETVRYAYDVYGRKLVVQLAWLKGLSSVRINHFACLSALYDCCVQQGGLERAHTAIRARVRNENPRTQTELVHIAVEERGRRANARWRADCVSRRLGILYRQPVKVTESGRTVFRDNPRLYLVRNSIVSGAEQFLS